MQMGPKYNHMCPYNRQTEGNFTKEECDPQCDQRDRNWSDAATNQGTLAIIRG